VIRLPLLLPEEPLRDFILRPQWLEQPHVIIIGGGSGARRSADCNDSGIRWRIKMAAGKRKEYGQYIVSDPQICGGELTFKGTRLFVRDVLDMLAKGYDRDRISAEFDGRVSPEAIAEAIELARQALMEKAGKRRRAA
jgi:uncharacterized protein (DUF433 family)